MEYHQGSEDRGCWGLHLPHCCVNVTFHSGIISMFVPLSKGSNKRNVFEVHSSISGHVSLEQILSITLVVGADQVIAIVHGSAVNSKLSNHKYRIPNILTWTYPSNGTKRVSISIHHLDESHVLVGITFRVQCSFFKRIGQISSGRTTIDN